jgi:hypothetical protein
MRSAERVHILHTPVGCHAPTLGRIHVIHHTWGLQRTTFGNQLLVGRLRVPRLVGCAALHHSRCPVPNPWETETRLADWQHRVSDAERWFLKFAFTLNDNGRLKYPELVFGAIKKSGKTTLAAIIMLAMILLYGGRYAEGICVANDLEQATSRVFALVKRIIECSPMLRTIAKPMSDRVTFPRRAGQRRPCRDGGGGEIARCLASARTGDRAFNIDPPTSSYAIMRRARSYRGENSGPGKDRYGELDTQTRN